MNTISTVNFVIKKEHTNEPEINSITSFIDDKEGNESVEKMMADHIRMDEDFIEADIESHIEDGYYICNGTGVSYYIIHSE